MNRYSKIMMLPTRSSRLWHICLLSAALSVTCIVTNAAAPPCQPTGPQVGLVIAVNFPSNPVESLPIAQLGDKYFGAVDSLRAYWEETSYGRTTLTGDTLGWFTLNYSGWETCDTYAIRKAALERAAQYVDLTRYNRILIRVMGHAGCDASILGTGSQCTAVPLPNGGSIVASTNWTFTDNTGVIIHESGHNLGLAHANSEDHGTGVVGPLGDRGVSAEYGDIFDVMGQSSRLGHHNAIYKYRMGFIDDTNIVKQISSGTNTIEPLTTAGGMKAIRIFRGAYWDSTSTPKQVRKEYFWVETRKKTGFDTNIYYAGETPQSVYGGALIHMDRTWGDNSQLLDMTPGSTANDFLDAPLAVGMTFTDPYTGIVIKNYKLLTSGGIKVTATIPAPDTDQDGVSDTQESAGGTNPAVEDTDGDTLSDFYERCYDNDCTTYNPGVTDTNATKADTDNDGMPDNWEIANTLNPLVADSSVDTDLDGLTNLREYQHSTNPKLADTDLDKLSDGEEVDIYNTNPLDGTDTDQDGMSNDWETARGINKLINDANIDSDNDGVVNVVEYLRGTLPLDGTSLPVIRTIYVDAAKTGGDGSAATPYASLTTALSNAKNGDTLQLATGTYYTVFSNQKSISLRGPADHSATVKAGVFIHSGALWGEFRDITLLLTGSNYFSSLRNFSLRNCVVNAVNGIIVNESRMDIRNCVHYGAGSTTTGIRFQNNNGVTINNATIADYGTGLSLYSGTTALTLRDSILANNDDLAGFTDTSGFAYNLIANGELAGVNGNFAATPEFVGSVNYHLLPSSHAIDAGDPLAAYSNEPENNGDRINLGAYGNTSEATAGIDSDGDGLTNQSEWCYDGDCGNYAPYNPLVMGAGNDLNIDNIDTDGDGYSDADEIIAKSNPLNANSIPVQADGDVNLDGLINVADVLLAQRHVLGMALLTPNGIAHADMYPPGGGDGTVTVQDLLLVMRVVMGP